MNETAFLIHGLFWQRYQSLGIGFRPIEGAVAVVNTNVVDFTYSGIVMQDDQSVMEEFTGRMSDHFGPSHIRRFVIDKELNHLSFMKKYDRREDFIDYRFSARTGNAWDGLYEGSVVGCGLSRCIVTEVPIDFFDPNPLFDEMVKIHPALQAMKGG